MVGYQNKTQRQQFNYVTPTFRPIAGLVGVDSNEMSINEIQMGAEKATASVKLQFLTSAGGKAVEYTWVKATDASKYTDIKVSTEGLNGVWAVKKSGMKVDYRDPNGTEAEPNTLKVGQGVQIGANEGDTVQFSGQVGEESVEVITRSARQQFNYFGNPFPQDASVNNIQLGADKATASVKLQFLTSAGGKAVEYTWVKASDASKYTDIKVSTEGLNGVWAVKKSGMKVDYRDPNGTEAEPTIVKAGECIQLGCQAGDQYWILCPYDL